MIDLQPSRLRALVRQPQAGSGTAVSPRLGRLTREAEPRALMLEMDARDPLFTREGSLVSGYLLLAVFGELGRRARA